MYFILFIFFFLNIRIEGLKNIEYCASLVEVLFLKNARPQFLLQFFTN
jgi:hypothetical protein